MSDKLKERFIKTAPIKFKPKDDKKNDPRVIMKAKPQGEAPKPYAMDKKICACEGHPEKV